MVDPGEELLLVLRCMQRRVRSWMRLAYSLGSQGWGPLMGVARCDPTSSDVGIAEKPAAPRSPWVKCPEG